MALPAADLWAALAPLVAARPHVRFRTGGGRYVSTRVRVDAGLPGRPAAVAVFAGDATTRCVVLDLDAHHHTSADVAADCALLEELAARHGLPSLVDESPNGGRHVYLPLQQPLAAADAGELARALARRFTTLDITPLLNPRTGAIRPPGSPHPQGGHQQLLTSLAEAVGAFAVPATPDAVSRLFSALRLPSPADPAGVPPRPSKATTPAPPPRPVLSGRTTTPATPGGRLPAHLQAIATGGGHDGYTSGSEARAAVLASAVRRGWTAAAIASAAKPDGCWPGLGALYARYGAQSAQDRALQADLARTTRWLAAQDMAPPAREGLDTGPSRPARSVVQSSPTRTPQPHPPGDPPTQGDRSDFLRLWCSALAVHERTLVGQAGYVDRLVLRALGWFADQRGSRYVDVGVRALGIRTGLDHTTAAASLRRLRQAPERMLELLSPASNGDGTTGDLYELTVPAHLHHTAADRTWGRGPARLPCPALQVLGPAVFLAYDAVATAGERDGRAATVDGIRQGAALPRRTVYAALAVLFEHGLLDRTSAGWVVRDDDPGRRRLLEQGRATTEVRLARARRDRQGWRTHLELRSPAHQVPATPRPARPAGPGLTGLSRHRTVGPARGSQPVTGATVPHRDLGAPSGQHGSAARPAGPPNGRPGRHSTSSSSPGNGIPGELDRPAPAGSPVPPTTDPPRRGS